MFVEISIIPSSCDSAQVPLALPVPLMKLSRRTNPPAILAVAAFKGSGVSIQGSAHWLLADRYPLPTATERIVMPLRDRLTDENGVATTSLVGNSRSPIWNLESGILESALF
jgi:hypothetical protein